MKLETYFNRYPNMKAQFWPAAEKISWDIKKPHPLVSLILGDDERTRRVAERTDNCCQQIAGLHPGWIKGKATAIIKESNLFNVSAILGEIRAFGELIWVWQGKVVPGNSGSDFSLVAKTDKIRIEVNTPQHRSKRNRIDHKRIEFKRISSQVSEIFPFGWPQRIGKDNAQGEAVSRLAAIKQAEHQFDDKGINILWFDLQDPTLWPLDFGLSEFEPLSTFQEQLTSGAFWNAFFAKKGTPIFNCLPMGGYDLQKTYQMEYDGRFWGKSKLDFVIADTRQHQVVFQNPNRSCGIPDWLFRDLHRLLKFKLGVSWLDWPTRAQLKSRVELALNDIAYYETAFEIADVAP